MNNTMVDTSLNMDTEGMLMKPECLLDLHCMNSDYMPKFDHGEFRFLNGLETRGFQKSPIKDVLHKSLTSVPKNNVNFPLTTKVNSTEKPYQCDTCKKRFSQQSNLCKHILIHSGLKPYICDICSKRFTQQANLVKHRRIHTGDKPFECKVCGRCFSQKANLNKHSLLHTGEKHFRCEFCDKSFVQQANLERHRRTHTGEKPYSCTICDKRFTQRGNLTKHMLIHSVKHEPTQDQFTPPKQTNKMDMGVNPFRKTEYDPNMALKLGGYDGYQFSVPVILSTKEGFFLKRL